MKRADLFIALFACLTLMAFKPEKMHTTVYKLDTNASKLEWFAEKLTGKHNGTINFSGGELRDNHGMYRGFAEVDMTTIKNLDMEEGKRGKLEGHLKSADFFDVEKYPRANFAITSITPIGNAAANEPTHEVKGNLTIKDKTNEVSFKAVMKHEGGKIACTGSLVVDRSKFDVRYGSKSFFADIGDNIIYDDFTLKFQIVAAL